MGTWTWTHVKIDKLTPEMVKSCVSHAKWLRSGSIYAEYLKMPWDNALKKWLDFNTNNYDYLVNECGVPKEKMTEEYLTKDLKKKLKDHQLKMECYDKCLAGEMSFIDMLKQTNQYNTHVFDDFLFRKKNGEQYVHIDYEIFRCWRDGGDLCTTEEIVEFCRNCAGECFMDYSLENPQWQSWTPELEEKVRKYYNEIGDGNFCVDFA